MKHLRFFVFFLCAFSLLADRSLQAADLSYDPYAPVYGEAPKPASNLKKGFSTVLIFPLELVRRPVDWGLNYTEQHHLYTKGIWAYDFVQDFGITPKLGIWKAGVDVDFVRLARQKVNHPDLTFKGDVFYESDVFSAGGRVGLERIGDLPIHVFQDVRYENRPNELFYGIGPRTSRGDEATYQQESTELMSIVGVSPTPTLSTDLKAGYRHINITNGASSGRGIIDQVFSGKDVPGLDGDELFTTGIAIERDTRNQDRNSTVGSLVRAGVDFNEGLFGSDARYLKYILEGSKYLKLGSERRILAGHLYSEYNQETHGKEVPFHQMARLGGYGDFPRLSQPLRGYDTNRFYDRAALLMNLEYRYTVYEYRDWKMDTVFFWDEGQVYNRMSKFRFDLFKESYGLGLRLSVLNHTIVSVEVAHGDEGTNFYVKSGAPF